MADDICEVCGKRSAKYEAKIEGAEIFVCEQCARMGKIIRELDYQPPQAASPMSAASAALATEPSTYRLEQQENELAEDYPRRIQKALSRLRITYHVLAERLMEKESYIEKITMGKAVPDDKIAKKIEKELNIALFEKPEVVSIPGKGKGKDTGRTFGDVIEIRKKK